MQTHDFVVVGKGIAGSILAYRLCKAGKSIVIVDEDSPNAAWKVAGGVWNAITFRKILKGWMADEMTKEATDFYKKLEVELASSFFEEKDIVKVFPDAHFQNSWYSKSGTSAFSTFLSDDIPAEIDDLPLTLPFGAGTVKNGGYVNLKVLIAEMDSYFRKNALLLDEKLDFSELIIKEGEIKYKEIKAKGIIFSEGYEVVNNPFFSWLPLSPTKGETLTLKNPGWKFTSILNNGKHLIDHHDGTMGVGATFEWKELNSEPTKKGRDELLRHLEKNFNYKNWEVLEQKAGVRPTVSDRRPLAGVHPILDNVFIFNGLGTKGVLIAPWLSKKMLEFLIDGTELPEEGNIRRFVKKHFR